MICLFSTLKAAMEFDEFVERSLPPIQNHVEIFGEQLIMNNMDYVTASYPYTLASATSISIDNVVALVRQYGGVAIPAHIDRPSFSVTANLGTVPDFGFASLSPFRAMWTSLFQNTLYWKTSAAF